MEKHSFVNFWTVLRNPKMRPCWPPNQGERSDRLICKKANVNVGNGKQCIKSFKFSHDPQISSPQNFINIEAKKLPHNFWIAQNPAPCLEEFCFLFFYQEACSDLPGPDVLKWLLVELSILHPLDYIRVNLVIGNFFNVFCCC